MSGFNLGLKAGDWTSAPVSRKLKDSTDFNLVSESVWRYTTFPIYRIVQTSVKFKILNSLIEGETDEKD